MGDPEDRRLTGFRITRHVDLNSPEVTERIRRLGEHLRQRYPNPESALHRAQKDAVALERQRSRWTASAAKASAKRTAPNCWLGCNGSHP